MTSGDVFSFDVFDTLLTRTVLAPRDVFYLTAEALNGSVGCSLDPDVYCRARQAAERQARRDARPRDDCRFVDIYRNFTDLARWGIAPEVAMRHELDVERSVVRPIAQNREIVRDLVRKGRRVVFLSDMYLPKEVILEFLTRHVYDVPSNTVFVSGDVGLGKYSGKLFEHVLESLSISPQQMFHVGDNPHADVRVPLRLGIRAQCFDEVNPTRYERCLPQKSRASVQTSSAGGVARVCRIGEADVPAMSLGADVRRVAATVIAPIVTAFVSWVLRDARARKIERLYFVARDGQIFHRVASEIRRSGDPECRYLYGSRHAWFLPSVRAVSLEELEWAWFESMPKRGIDILRRLDLADDPQVAGVLAEQGFTSAMLSEPLRGERLAGFKDVIVSSPISERLSALAEERREAAMAYFRQEGLFQHGSWALVDVGWAGNLQRALSRIIREENPSREVSGYYFGIARETPPVEDYGQVRGFVGIPGACIYTQLKARWFFKLSTVLLIEHLFTAADHATTRCYRWSESGITPVLLEEDRDMRLVQVARGIQAVVVRYALESARHPALDTSSHAFWRFGLAAMERFCTEPDAGDVAAFAWLRTNKDQSHDEAHSSALASPLGFDDLIQFVWHEWTRQDEGFFCPRFSWIEGSVAVSPWWIRRVFRGLVAVKSAYSSVMRRWRPPGQVT